jgi:uncharacterized protein YndB with AHSA1/START domain
MVLPQAMECARCAKRSARRRRNLHDDDWPNAGVYLEVDVGRRLVTTDAFASAWQPSGKAFMVAEITLSDAPGGGTLYRAVARHWSLEDRDSHEKMGFHEGWGKAADQLEALAKTL